MDKDIIAAVQACIDGGISIPRVHPNGFIQLDLSDDRRMHVWHPFLPYRQKTFSPVHNHIFSFRSTVYVGRMINVIYDLEPCDQGLHEEWQVRIIAGEDTKLVKSSKGRISLRPRETTVVMPGQSYNMAKYEFHETLNSEPTLTVIEKSDAVLNMGPNCEGASVIVPFNEEPDNDFRRGAVDVGTLWDLILSTMQRGLLA